MITKIITHNGIFHADEVFAVALLKQVFRKIPIERKREISEEEYNDPNVWIIDVGGRYEPELNNLDHHHDASLEAACVLVLQHLLQNALISIELYTELYETFMSISYIDRNGFEGLTGFQVNSLIKSFNALPAEDKFMVAVTTAEFYIMAAQQNVLAAVESQKIWDEGVLVSMYIRVCNKFPVHWKRYQEQPYLIYPDKGRWTLLSINSLEFPIYATGKQEFIHNGKFIAVFRTKEDAIQSAQMSAYNVVG